MARDWEAQFREWAKPPGKTEQERCDNAVSAIRNAIKASDKLNRRDITFFVQGSYRNNTNVRKDSDVDVGILCKDVFYTDLPEGLTDADLGFSDAAYKYAQFKNEVEEALASYFGRAAVKRGNKAIDVHETTYHVEADVAPFFEHRRYSINKSHISGVELRPDNGGKVINWPEQHYENGCGKNTQTNTRYKSIVRVLKALSNEMTEHGVSKGNIPGFLIECLGWNVPNDRFAASTYVDCVKAGIIYLYEQTKTDDTCKEWGEVSELKYLFRASQKWTREQANAFTVAAWNYAELEEQS
jgi:predicted nucleotidyltransferase